jgi:hypothetical protein
VLEKDADYMDEPDESGEWVDAEGVVHATPPSIQRFRYTSLGTMLAAGMIGLREVLEPEKDDTPAIVENWAGGEPFDDPYVMRLDPDNPQDSIVMIRPWLRDDQQTTD